MKLTGPWDRDRVDEFLEEARIPVRVGCRTPADDPWIVSLWFAWDGAVHCATGAHADIVDFLEHDARVSFDVSTNDPPYRGFVGAEPRRSHRTRRRPSSARCSRSTSTGPTTDSVDGCCGPSGRRFTSGSIPTGSTRGTSPAGCRRRRGRSNSVSRRTADPRRATAARTVLSRSPRTPRP